MGQRLIRLPLVVLFLLSASSFAFAQGGATSSLAGTVVDEQGGAMPGASVTITNVATGEKFDTMTNETGTFLVPALPVGTYTVTVSIDGFKTALLEDVALNAGVPASVRAVLQIGTLQETVVVSGAGSIVQTQSTAVATTMDVNQIGNLPLVSRNTLDFIVFLPGVNTPGGNRDSTVNGLPQSTINITVDGMNVQDNYLKTTDGFFARMSPRLDAVEEVTVSSAAQGAEAAGQGAVQIRYVTRSGSNNFAGSVYWYYRNDALNANTWFNERDGLAKPELLQNQVGFRVGGPIVIPGLYDGRNKAFYFVNYEEFRQPQTIRRDRTILSPEAQAGIFRYNTSSGVRSVDLMALAASSGQLATFDPVVANLLAAIRSSTGGAGSITDLDDPNLQRFSWNVDQRSHNRYPTGRIDYNLTDSHRLTGSINYQKIQSLPDTLNSRDPYFPGFAVQGNQISHRYTWSTTLRSTLGSNLVNEFRVGGTGGPTYFSNELNAGMYDDQAGYYLNIGTANITNAGGNATPSSREASTKVVENTVNWLKGNHSLNFGGSFTQADVWARNQNLVPQINFDVVTGDPADSLFTSTNFPGSSSTNRNDAGDLYAVLTGRISAINGNAAYDSASGKFVYLAERLQQGQLRDFGFHAQDSWRVRPDLTVNFGLRWELQLPFHPLNDSYSNSTYEDVWGISGLASTCADMSNITPGNCNLFKPGVEPGKAVTEYIPFKKGEYGYDIDWNNIAPSAGVAWTPAADEGWLSRFVGAPGDTVLRAGYARAYNRPGMSDFTGRYDDNPGILITTNRSLSDGNLGTPLPLLLRESNRLGPPAFNEDREYPMTDVATGDVTIFDKNIQIPSADTWSFGYQRAVSKNMAMEIRYVGTRSRDGWVNYNVNELNIVENGFLDEFKLAQQNLQANIAAGRGANFKYYGAGTGTSPLPIFLAYFSGRTDATNASAYSSSNFSSSTFVNPLAVYNPQPYTSANALDADATRRSNALKAGLPSNFLVANPDKLGGARFAGNGDYTRYHSLQLELRRRMADGLQFQMNYVYGRAYQGAFYSFRKPWVTIRDSGGEGGVTHAFKANWVYELPFGQGRRFGTNVGGALDRLVGGWQIHGTARFQSGRMVDFGNVRLVGFSEKDLRDMYKVRIDQNQFVWMLPEDVIDNTVRAFSVSATSPTGYSELGPPEGRYFAPANGPGCIELAQVDGDTGYGDCGDRSVVVSGPMFKNVDLSIVKLVPIVGKVRAEFRLELLNAFNWVNYVPVTGIGSDPTDYEVTALNGAVTSRIIQVVSRVTW